MKRILSRLGLFLSFIFLFVGFSNYTYAQVVQWYPTDTPYNDTVIWANADSACTALGTGWRLPTLSELTTKYGENHSEFFLALDPTLGKYWTSTFNSTYPDRAYYVDMYNGTNYSSASSTSKFASHCIRNAVAPNAPTIGTATPGDASATVSFSAPSDNGGSSILYYTVTSSSTFSAITASGTSSPIIISGLTNGTPYTFTVTATNVIGTSTPSTDSNVITPSHDYADVSTAKGVVSATSPWTLVQGIDINALTSMQAIVDNATATSGVVVSIDSSSNSHVATNGTITYDLSTITANVTFLLTKNIATDTQVVSVTVAQDTQALAVYNLVDALVISNLATSSASLVSNASSSYDSLSSGQKILITNFSNLQAAQDQMTKLNATEIAVNEAIASTTQANIDTASTTATTLASGTAKATYFSVISSLQSSYDSAAASVISGIITSLPGTITIETIGNVYAARSAYDALTEDQKALVANYATLTAAEAQIPALFTVMFNTVHTQLESTGILNNLNICGGASSTACSGLYFEKSGFGKITFPGALDLTSTSTIATLSTLDTGISFANGEIKFTAQAGDAFKVLGGELEMYGLNYSDTPTIYVDGVPSTGTDVESISYSSTTGTLTFNAKHFSTFTVKSNTKAFTSFNFTGLGTGVIDEGNHAISVTVPYGTDVSSLVATFTMTGVSTVVAAMPQTSGITANNFTSPVSYAVMAEDNTAQNYLVTVTVALNPAKAITAFTIPGQVGTTEIDEGDHTITFVMSTSTGLATLVPTITITGASVSPASGASNDFSATTTYVVTAADSSTTTYVVTAIVLLTTQTAPNTNGEATVSTTTPEVVVTSSATTTLLTINDDVTDPKVNVSSFIGSNGTGTIPAIIINSTTANVEIPDATEIVSASTSWDGVISAPKTTTISLPNPSGETRTFSAGIELGFSGVQLTFSKAVRILLPGQAGKRVGYTRDAGTTFTEITNICSADTQVAGDALTAGSECKKDVGSDLVLWTKHFTTFATYTQTTNQTYSGGGTYAYSGLWATTPAIVATTTATSTVVAVTAALPVVTATVTPSLSLENKFMNNLQVGSKGDDVTELQKLLVREGYLIMPKGVAYGYYGSATKAAVIKYQKAKGISAIGKVGPQTRQALNSSNSSTLPAQNIASMTLKELLQMLLQIGAIATDKIDAANKLINSL